MRGPLPLVLGLLLALPGCLSATEPPTAVPTPEPLIEPPPITYEALRFETSHGAIVALLYPEDAPETVAFMKRLVSSGYYDGREFNRAIPGFVIQEVDKAGGATDQKETIPLEAGKRSMFSAGALGIARNADPNSGGSEFFIMDFAASHLYGNYTVFGQVIEGMEAVHAIARVDTVTFPASPVPGVDIPYPMDRMAVSPGKITKATVTTVTVPGLVAQALPYQVANMTRTDDYRYIMEYPSNLTKGGFHLLTWYAWARGENAQAASDYEWSVAITGPGNGEVNSLHVDGMGIIEFSFEPDAVGAYTMTLLRDGAAVATATVTVT